MRAALLNEGSAPVSKSLFASTVGSVSEINSRIREAKTGAPNFSACRRSRERSHFNVSNCSIADTNEAGVCSSKKRPVSPSTTVSMAPPARKAITGRPAAFISSGVIPKSSSPGKTKARHRSAYCAATASGCLPRNRVLRPHLFSICSLSGPSPITIK